MDCCAELSPEGCRGGRGRIRPRGRRASLPPPLPSPTTTSMTSILFLPTSIPATRRKHRRHPLPRSSPLQTTALARLVTLSPPSPADDHSLGLIWTPITLTTTRRSRSLRAPPLTPPRPPPRPHLRHLHRPPPSMWRTTRASATSPSISCPPSPPCPPTPHSRCCSSPLPLCPTSVTVSTSC